MSKALKYYSEFTSRRDVRWRVEILVEAFAGAPALVSLPGDEAVTIEWEEVEKWKPVQGSSCTLKLLSESDRQFIDLFSVKPAQIRLDLYRDGTLYWSGCLDPEFYEEPYATAQGYEVSLTFSDLGILDRLDFDMEGVPTLLDILQEALQKCAVNAVLEQRISTSFPDDQPLGLSSLRIRADDFTDEDGDPCSWLEVVEAVLQPLALRVIQREGRLWVYDLNALAADVPSVAVPQQPSATVPGASAQGVIPLVWASDDQSLSTDRVYNNVSVSFSPYARASVVEETAKYFDVHGQEWSNLSSQMPNDTLKYWNDVPPLGIANRPGDCFSFYPDYRRGDHWDYNNISFTVFTSNDTDKFVGIESLGSGHRFFCIQKVLGGEDSVGISGGFYTQGHWSVDRHLSDPQSAPFEWPANGYLGEHPANVLAFSMKRAFLATIAEAGERNRYLLRLRLPLLFDPRYNPFEGPGEYNEEDHCDDFKEGANKIFVPVAVTVYGEDGTALCHYSNQSLMEQGSDAYSVTGCAGEWLPGEATFGEAWLAWWPTGDRPTHERACDGWTVNRQNFGCPDCDDDWFMADSFKAAPEGQFMPYPPYGGYVQIKVFAGVWAFDWDDVWSLDLSSSEFARRDYYRYVRWQLYQLPTLGVVNRNLVLDEAELDDVGYSGRINPNAKEEIEIETICGTTDTYCPTSRGVFIRAADGTQVRTLKRAGVTDHPEQLLIGTICSQHSRRMTRLSGTVFSPASSFGLFSEASQPASRRFMITAEAQDLQDGTSEATFTEIRPDEWKGADL